MTRSSSHSHSRAIPPQSTLLFNAKHLPLHSSKAQSKALNHKKSVRQTTQADNPLHVAQQQEQLLDSRNTFTVAKSQLNQIEQVEQIPSIQQPPISSNRASIYQLLVRTFGNVKGVNQENGDLETNGVGKFSDINDAALDGIRALGTTHVWLTGVLRQATATDYSEQGMPADDPDILKGKAGSPYAIKDYYDVCPDYADDPAKGLEEFQALAARIHAKGMKVLIDLVPNHVARSYASRIHPESDFGKNDDQGKFYDPQNNFYYLQDQPGRGLHIPESKHWSAPGTDGKFAPEDGSPGRKVKMTGNRATYEPNDGDWKETIKFNYGLHPHTNENSYYPIPDTWKKMDRVLAFWQSKGVDGFRVDYAHVVPQEFWQWALPRARERDPNVWFGAEAYETAMDKIPGFTLKSLVHSGFDAVYNDELYDFLREELLLKDGWANDITSFLEKNQDIRDSLLHYAENHDEARLNARRRDDDLSASGLENPWVARPMCSVLFLATHGPNLIYNGQESGERAEGDEGFGRDDGRTSIFDYWTMTQHAQWVVEDHSYTGEGYSEEQKELRKFYEHIGALARSPLFAEGERYNIQGFNKDTEGYGPGKDIYSFVRYDKEGNAALVVANFSKDAKKIPKVKLPPDFFETAGLSQDTTFQMKSLMGNAKIAKAATASGLSEQGLEVEVDAYGLSVIELTPQSKPL